MKRKTEKGVNIKWITHLLLVSGYGLMLVIIVFFLKWFQTDEIYPIWHPQRWLGYYATAVLLFGAGSALWGRIKKNSQLHRFSHLSDWIFPVLLLVVALTGILIHTFRYVGNAVGNLLHVYRAFDVRRPDVDPGSPIWKMVAFVLPPIGDLFPGDQRKSKASTDFCGCCPGKYRLRTTRPRRATQ